MLGKMQCKTMVTFSALNMRELKLKKELNFFVFLKIEMKHELSARELEILWI